MAVADLGKALLAGAAGAAALTIVHEAGRRAIKNSPRMDVLGRRAIVRWLPKIGIEPPVDRRKQEPLALVGDLAANTAYYALVAAGQEGAWWRGAGLGTAAGVAALVLAEPLGLGTPPHSSHASTNALTVAWYLIGGLTAAAVATALSRREPITGVRRV